MRHCGIVDGLSACMFALRWFESGCHQKKKSDAPQNGYIYIYLQQQNIKTYQGGARNQGKLVRSARIGKLNRPTWEMPGKHQPSAFSTNIFVGKSIFLNRKPLNIAVHGKK